MMKDGFAFEMLEGDIGWCWATCSRLSPNAKQWPMLRMPRSRRSRRARTPVCSSCICANASSAALPSPTMAGTFSVPPRRRRSCGPPRISGWNGVPLRRIERADALGAVQLVSRQRQHVDRGRLQIDRDLAGGLHRISVEQRTGAMRQFGELFDRKQCSGLVIGPHHRGDRGARTERTPIGFKIEPALRIDADPVDFYPARLFQMLQQRQDGGMLDRRRDDLVAAVRIVERRENGGCCRLRCRRR